MGDVDQIEERRPGGQIAEALGPSPGLQWLLNYARGHARDRERAIDALLAWKALFERESDHAALLELDRAGEACGIGDAFLAPIGEWEGFDASDFTGVELTRYASFGELLDALLGEKPRR